ncbi:MAG TPA: hypothetical protein VF893_05480 [Candidatus Bathyarchaeia archaeon]
MSRIPTLVNNAFGRGSESSLHSAIKKWYFLEGDKLEGRVDDFVVDIVRGDLLIEIQTANFSAIKPKLLRLLNNHKVRLVYPIPKEKWIVHKSTVTRETYGRRRSPKEGGLSDLFSELIRIPSLIATGNFSIEVLMIEMEEIWFNDGRGSWRRKGASIEDRKLIRVFERTIFEHKTDFLKVLPEGLPDPFSNRNLGKRLGIPVIQSRKMTYVLRRIGTIAYVGKSGNQMLFARAHQP